MSEYTPEPWSLWHNEKGAFVVTKGPDGAVLCQRNDWDHRAPESIANAHVIVAAPKMLAGLKAIRDGTVTGKVGGNDVVWFDDITTLYDFCEELIAEAEGL